MIGLLMMGALALWFVVAILIARWLARAIPINAKARFWAAVAFFVAVFLLPVADELAARPFFNGLCRHGAIPDIDAAKIAGRRVRLVAAPENARVPGLPIPIYHSHFEYRDAATGEVLGHYEMYLGEGGLIARTVRFPSAHPLTGSFFCAPKDEGSIPARYGFVVLR